MKFEYSITNTQLVQRCLRGESQAWESLVERYAALVHSVPIRHRLTPAEVEDVGQDVFLALAQNLHQLEDPERIPAWLVTTARRLCWRVIQKGRREAPAVEGDLNDAYPERVVQHMASPIPTITELQTGWDRQETLAMGLQRLGERCRNLLTMIFLDTEEPSYDEVSQRLGIPKGSIGPTRNRCLKQLRTLLEGLGFSSVVEAL